MWRQEGSGCSDCEWTRLVRWAVQERLVRNERADPVEVSRAILGHIEQLRSRRGPG